MQDDIPTMIMRQAPMAVGDWMHDAITKINKTFGDDYAEKHPELVAGFIKACATEQLGMCVYHLSVQLGRAADDVLSQTLYEKGE